MNSDLEARLSQCRNLPTLPGAALRLVELAQDPDADMIAAAEVLARDPALAAKILRVANSSLYATNRKVENLRQALTLLGLNATLSLALGFSLTHSLRQACASASYMEPIWRRSMLAATVCRSLADKLQLARAEEVMLAGLLQDIGMLALGVVEPVRYPALLDEVAQGASQLSLERELFGADHAETGAWLARHWRLPGYLAQAIGQSEGEEQDGQFNCCVSVSGPVAELWMHAADESVRRLAYALAETRLGMAAPDFADVVARVSEAIPDYASLFDMKLADPAQVDTILDHARELLVIRNLRDIQDALRMRREAEELQGHARILEDRARRDPLTGLFNRNHFLQLLAGEFEVARRFGSPLSLVFIDLDDFKKVNDRHGHLVGDEVLKQFAAVLTMNLRSSDVLCRFGGEEFLLMLPGTEATAAVNLLRRTLFTIADTPMAQHQGDVIKVTASMGLATFDESSHYDSVDSLLRAADHALYGAKDTGRNRLLVADPDEAAVSR